jgi:hypothetical protein
MATWVPFVRAKQFPNVLKVYERAGHGQGQGAAGTNSKKGFWYAVKAAVTAGSSWVRKDSTVAGPGTSFQGVMVDVTAIPNVPPLRKDGRRTIAPN